MLEVEINVKLLSKGALGVAELLTLFKYPDAISEIPLQPKGGAIFVLKYPAARKTIGRQMDTRKLLFFHCILLLLSVI